MQPEEWFGAEQLLPSPKQRCWAPAKPWGSRKRLQPCPGSSHRDRHRHTLTHTDTLTHTHTQVFTPGAQSSPAVPPAHKPAHKEHSNTFPSPSKALPIHAVSDSRSIRYWRDLANWLHLSFPRVKIGTEGGWSRLFSLALHFTHTRHKRCHYNTGKGCKQELQTSLTRYISYLSLSV